jgi:hypothetical protein
MYSRPTNSSDRRQGSFSAGWHTSRQASEQQASHGAASSGMHGSSFVRQPAPAVGAARPLTVMLGLGLANRSKPPIHAHRRLSKRTRRATRGRTSKSAAVHAAAMIPRALAAPALGRCRCCTALPRRSALSGDPPLSTLLQHSNANILCAILNVIEIYFSRQQCEADSLCTPLQQRQRSAATVSQLPVAMAAPRSPIQRASQPRRSRQCACVCVSD